MKILLATYLTNTSLITLPVIDVFFEMFEVSFTHQFVI